MTTEAVALHIVISCLALLVAQSGMTLYLPSLPAISNSLNGLSGFSALTLTAFLVGMGAPMLIWPKIAGLIGSRRTLVTALWLFAASSAWAGLALNTEIFLACRFVQGVAAGAISVMVRAMLRDSVSGGKLAEAMSWLSMCFVVSLGLAQLCGSVLFAVWGWQSIFFVSAVASVVVALSVIRYLPDSSATAGTAQPVGAIYPSLLNNPQFIKPVLAGGLGYGVVILFSARAPDIFQYHYNWSVVQFGLLGIPVSAAYLIGALSISGLTARKPIEHLLSRGVLALFTGALIMAGGHMLFPSDAAMLWLPYCVLLAVQALVYPVSLSVAAQATTAGSVHVMALAGIIHQLTAAVCGFAASFMPFADPRSFVCACIALTATAIFVYFSAPPLSRR